MGLLYLTYLRDLSYLGKDTFYYLSKTTYKPPLTNTWWVWSGLTPTVTLTTTTQLTTTTTTKTATKTTPTAKKNRQGTLDHWKFKEDVRCTSGTLLSAPATRLRTASKPEVQLILPSTQCRKSTLLQLWTGGENTEEDDAQLRLWKDARRNWKRS